MVGFRGYESSGANSAETGSRGRQSRLTAEGEREKKCGTEGCRTLMT